MNIEQIARVAHEMNRAYCQAIGDNSQPEWKDAPQWQKDSAIVGVYFHLHNPEAGPDASHNSWLAEKEKAGWKYGTVKNHETKEHPCFVPYAELPSEQKAKDYLFRQTVHSLAPKRNTRGQQVMSVQFNPGQREDVASIKLACADLFDLIDEHMENKRKEFLANKPEYSTFPSAVTPEGIAINDAMRLASIAKTNLETAQMYAVKAVTR